MKNRLIVFGILLLVLLGASITSLQQVVKKEVAVTGEKEPVKGVWINCYEFGEMISGKTQEQYQQTVEQVLDNIQSVGLNTVFLHVRSHSDSFYPSTIFPWSKQINQGEGVDYDPLACFVRQAHQRGIKLHAWLNPYRVSGETVDQLSAGHPAYEMREDTNKLVEVEGGVYYNPSSAAVRELVLSGVREILDNYPVDGIQYDDYFYPTTDPTFDAVAYQQYCDQTDRPMTLASWRQCQVNLLISGTYQMVKQYDGVVFGVSPAADIEKNRETLYADVAQWVEGGYVDYLCPQLYFGFEYPTEAFRFDSLLSQWQTLAGRVPLYIGLASYKVGQPDGQSEEWVTSTDLLARETDYVFALGEADGICVYHYTSLFQIDAVATAQRENLKEALNRFT